MECTLNKKIRKQKQKKMNITYHTLLQTGTQKKGKKTIKFFLIITVFDCKYCYSLAVNNFQIEATKAQIDLIGDSSETQRITVQQKKWDRKKKKMITVNPVSDS